MGPFDPVVDCAGVTLANRLDSSPEIEIEFPSVVLPPKVTSYHSVARKALEVLELSLPSIETKIYVLTEVLQPTAPTSEPFLPLNETLLDMVLSALEKPTSAPAENRFVAQH